VGGVQNDLVATFTCDCGELRLNFMNMRKRNAEIRGLMKGIIAKVETEMDFSDIVNRNFINDDGGDNDIR
jgi:hypothetical protein